MKSSKKPKTKHPVLPPPGLLLTYLADSAGSASPESGADPASSAPSPRLLLWSRAFDDWLAERERPPRLRPNRAVRLASQRWWSRAAKPPWQVTPQDLEAHAAWMRLQGYAAATIYHDLSTLSSFYRWCAQHAVDPACPSGFNPAAAARRQRAQPYAKAQILTPDQARALLAVFQTEGSPLSLRDHAFFLARLRLGLPHSRLLQLRWGQIEHDETRALLRWAPRQAPLPLPPEVWDAIQSYLHAAGRWEAMQPASYIFVPLADPLADHPAGQLRWNETRPMHAKLVKATLKAYGQLAGIPAPRLTLSALRHTALLLRVQAGDSLHQLQQFLGDASLKNTRQHVDSLTAALAQSHPQALIGTAAQAQSHPQAFIGGAAPLDHLPDVPVGADALAAKQPAALLPTPPQTPPPLPEKESLPDRKPNRFKEWQTMTHGAKASRQPPEEMAEMLKAMQAEEVVGLEDEICGLREVGRRLLAMHVQADSGREEAQLGEAYTAAAQRLGSLVEAERKLAEKRRASQGGGGLLAAWDEMAVKAGWEVLPSEEVRQIAAQGITGTSRRLDEEVAAVRLVLRRTLALVMGSQDPAELIRLAEIYGSGCLRLVRLLKVEGAAEGQLEEILKEAILEGLRLAHDDIFGRVEDDGVV